MILDEIVSIRKVGKRKTVDIEVDGPDHLFFCNGILTHNSAAGRLCPVSW
jgi:intein/homing endonuclease